MEGPLVLIRAAESEFIRDFRSVKRHVAVVEGAPEAVVHHEVQDGARREAHPAPPAHLRQAERGVGHALLAAGDADLRASELDHLAGEVDRLDPGGADLVDGDAGDRFGKTRQDGGLTTGDLAGPGGDDLPHEDIIHIGRFDLPVRPAEDLLDGQGAEFRRGKSLERPAEAAVRRPAGLDEDDFPEVRRMPFFPTRRRKIGFPTAVFHHGGAGIFIRERRFQFLGDLSHAYSPIVSTNSISRGTLYEER